MLLVFLGGKNYSRLCISYALNHPLLQVHPPTENSKLPKMLEISVTPWHLNAQKI